MKTSTNSRMSRAKMTNSKVAKGKINPEQPERDVKFKNGVVVQGIEGEHKCRPDGRKEHRDEG